MQEVQNFCYQNKSYLEPALLVGTAFLAGRFIEHFSKASQSGLYLSGGLAALGTCIYNHTIYDDGHDLLSTLMGKVVTLAATNMIAVGISKSLSDKGVSFSPAAALKYGAIQLVASSLIYAIAVKAPKTIQEEHQEYQLSPRKWSLLTKEERTEKIKAFIEADLPPVSLDTMEKNPKFDQSILVKPNTLDEWKALSVNKFYWHEVSYFELNDKHMQWEIFEHFVNKGARCIPKFIEDKDFIESLHENDREFIYQHLEDIPYYSCIIPSEVFSNSFPGKTQPENPSFNISKERFVSLTISEQTSFIHAVLEQDKFDELPGDTLAHILKLSVYLFPEDASSEKLIKSCGTEWIIEEKLTPEEISDSTDFEIRAYFNSMIRQDEMFKGFTPEQKEAFVQRFNDAPYHVLDIDIDQIRKLDPSLLTLCKDLIALTNNTKYVKGFAGLEPRYLLDDREREVFERQFEERAIESKYTRLYSELSSLTLENVQGLTNEELTLYFHIFLYGNNDNRLDVLGEGVTNTLLEKFVSCGILEQHLQKKFLNLTQSDLMHEEVFKRIYVHIFSNPDFLDSLTEHKKEAIISTLIEKKHSFKYYITPPEVSAEAIQKLPLDLFKIFNDKLDFNDSMRFSEEQRNALQEQREKLDD